MPAIVDFGQQGNRTIDIASPSGAMQLVLRPISPEERLSDSATTYVAITANASERPGVIKSRVIDRLQAVIDWREVRDTEGRSIPFTSDRLRQLMSQSPQWLECLCTAINAHWNAEPEQAPTEQAA